MKTVAVVAMAALAMTACNNQPQENNSGAAQPAASNGGPRIAYIVLDSIQSQYQLCKDIDKIVNEKKANATNAVNQKQQALQSAAANFESKYKNNGFSSQEEFSRTQAALQKQQQDVQELASRFDSEITKEQLDYLKGINDSIDHFLARYNKDKKYDFIFTKGSAAAMIMSGSSGLLYANGGHDITKDVVAGLNKAYKPIGKNAAKKEEPKKDEAKK